jgi:hypothetical protein
VLRRAIVATASATGARGGSRACAPSSSNASAADDRPARPAPGRSLPLAPSPEVGHFRLMS